MTIQQFGIDRMSFADRMDLIGQIWDSLIDEGAPLLLPDEHRDELERRIQAADANPAAAKPWEEVKARLLGRS
jgi:putative addiction module component (TIGR02574 family)